MAWPTLPALEQRQLDLIGLALVAAGIFFAGLDLLHWDGGDGGHWALDGLRTLIGAVHYGFPVALIAIGALVVLRADAPRGAAVPCGRPVPVRGAADSGSRPGPPVSARAGAPCTGTPRGSARAAAWSARGSTG